MRQMLMGIEQYPLVGMLVLLIFVSLFSSIVFIVFRDKNKQAFRQASRLPLGEDDRGSNS